VEAVETLDTNLLDKDLIGIKLVTGGSITVKQQKIFQKIKKSFLFDI